MDYVSLAVEEIERVVKKSLNDIFEEESLKNKYFKFLVELSEREEFGDFATNVAMVAAKIFRKPPVVLAESIVKNISFENSFFERCEVKKPGFINFFLKDSWFVEVLKNVLEEKELFGRTDYGKNKKVILEFVSANPTGPMHIGNARGGAIGDALAECYKFAGFFVVKEFYVNDAGNQIAKFKNSLFFRYEQLTGSKKEEYMPDGYYLGEDIIKHVENFLMENGNKISSCSDEEKKEALLNYALPINIKNLKLDLLKYNVEYDNWFFESDLYKKDEVLKIVYMLKEKGYAYEKDGAVWFSFTKCSGEKDEVLVRDSGVPTYFASDIAYHYDKFEKRGFDLAINVWGADHHGHVERLKAALKVLGVRGSLEVVLMQMVRLVNDGETLKLSKRLGNTISLNDLLNIIPIDVARFFFNMKEPNSHFDFDLNLAKQQSEKNPVYYVQYAYARICGILKNLNEESFVPNLNSDFYLLKTPEEKQLIKHMAKFPYEIKNVVQTNNPARIVHFTMEFATLFHKFYVNCKIKGQEQDVLNARLCLCFAVKEVLYNIFSILKIKAKEEV